MDLSQLKKIVRDGEGANVEFKKKINHPEKVIREVVAFANSTGGHLLVGVDDNGELSGLAFPTEEAFILDRAIQDLCRPKIDFNVEIIDLPTGKAILHYEIKEGAEKPYFAFLNKKHRLGKAYIRVADRSVQASRELRKTLQWEHSKRASGFSYGEIEKKLMNYLGNNDHITLKEFCNLTNLSDRQASDVIVGLAQNHVIKIVPREQEDWYVFTE